MGLLDWFRRPDKQEGVARIEPSHMEPFVVVCVIVAEGVGTEDGLRLRELFNVAKPIGWTEEPPRIFQAFFRTDKSGRAQSAELITQLNNLKTTVSSLSGLRVGTAEGPLLVSRKAGGGLKFPLIGEVNARAMRNAFYEESAVPPEPLPPGFQLARWMIETELPQMRMGRAYKARHASLGRTVAIHTLSATAGDAGLYRFLECIRRAATNTDRVYEVGEHLGIHYVVIAYTEGVGAAFDIANF